MGLWERLSLSTETHRVVTLVGGGGKTTTMYALAREARDAGKTVIVTTTTHILPHPALFLTGDRDETGLPALLARYGIVTVGRVSGETGKMTGVDNVAACARAADVVLVEGDGAKLRPLKAPAEHEPVVPPESAAVVAVAGLDALGRPIADACHRPELVAALLDKPVEARIAAADFSAVLRSPLGGRKRVEAGMAFRCVLNKADTEERRAAGENAACVLAAEGIPCAITYYTEEEQGGLCWF